MSEQRYEGGVWRCGSMKVEIATRAVFEAMGEYGECWVDMESLRALSPERQAAIEAEEAAALEKWERETLARLLAKYPEAAAPLLSPAEKEKPC